MRRFAALFDALDASTATSAKVAALVAYFEAAPPDDAAWAVALLTGRRLKRLVKLPDLRRWAAEAAGISEWLFEASYAQAGDLAETIALLVPEGSAPDAGAGGVAVTVSNEPADTSAGDAMGVDADSLATWITTRVQPLATLDPDAQRATLLAAWRALTGTERFVFNKLITGAFRVGVSQGLVARAIAQVSGQSADVIAHRLAGTWEPGPGAWARLVTGDASDVARRQPYPFFLAHPLEGDPAALGPASAWSAEWKWDGIRAQVIRRDGTAFTWSRGDEPLDGRFPEVEQASAFLPDGTVLDGELLAWRDGAPLPFQQLQRRINRKTVGVKLLAEVPCALIAYDLLEHGGTDIRALPLDERRARLEAIVRALPTGAPIHLSPRLDAPTWEALAAMRAQARAHQAEGLMIKRCTSPYGTGRRGGDWLKWKVDPLTVDAVLTYAQAGHGRRAGLFTDYTFGVWDGDQLVTVAKAYSGLSDAEIAQVDRWIRRHTTATFGPVREVVPELVFELGFEGIQRSTRHKSGIAVRFPRILRWRTDKPAREADTLDAVRRLAEGA